MQRAKLTHKGTKLTHKAKARRFSALSIHQLDVSSKFDHLVSHVKDKD
jgi:hypothetical protein